MKPWRNPKETLNDTPNEALKEPTWTLRNREKKSWQETLEWNPKESLNELLNETLNWNPKETLNETLNWNPKENLKWNPNLEP